MRQPKSFRRIIAANKVRENAPPLDSTLAVGAGQGCAADNGPALANLSCALFDALTAPKIVKVCSCRRAYTAEQWAKAEYVGRQEMHGNGPDLEIRQCVCGSSMAIEVLP